MLSFHLSYKIKDVYCSIHCYCSFARKIKLNWLVGFLISSRCMSTSLDVRVVQKAMCSEELRNSMLSKYRYCLLSCSFLWLGLDGLCTVRILTCGEQCSMCSWFFWLEHLTVPRLLHSELHIMSKLHISPQSQKFSWSGMLSI